VHHVVLVQSDWRHCAAGAASSGFAASKFPLKLLAPDPTGHEVPHESILFATGIVERRHAP
jgi:hypothetical protein